MKKLFFLNFVLLVTVSFLVIGCKEAVELKQNMKPQEAKSSVSLAPDFNLPNLEGDKITLSELRGKVVVIDFWATWCPPCRKEIPGFIKLYEKYKDKGLEIIGVSVESNAEEKLASFIKEWNINYPIVIGNDKIGKDYGGIRAIPTTFIIGKKGAIRKKHIGYTSQEVFENEIKELLNE